jgi:TRAP transporter 4TM/12TM fusion protein
VSDVRGSSQLEEGRDSRTRVNSLENWLNGVVIVVASSMFLYHMVSCLYLIQGPIEFQNTHFALGLLIIFLRSWKSSKKFFPLWLGLIIVSLVATGYVMIFYPELEWRAGSQTTIDVIIGTLLILLAIIATKQAFGWGIPIVASIFLTYLFLGYYLPEPFYHYKYSYSRIISGISIGLTGMYGPFLGASSNYIFLFVVFGGMLQASGTVDFILAVGKIISKKLRGGAAQTAVISSSLIGMVTGVAVANVAITGSFTIPMMKRLGYKPSFAGAVEAAASSGGQIMPPIMGASAFLMAAILGIPYVNIMIIAFLPAILFYLTIMIGVELEARKMKIVPSSDPIDIRILVLKGPTFIIPLLLIIALLVIGYSVMFAAFWAIISLIILNIIIGLFKKDVLPSLQQWIDGVVSGVATGAGIGVLCACLGPITTSMTMSGLSLKFSSAAAVWCGDNLFFAMLFAAAIGIILGMGLPTLAAYALVAILMAPVMQTLGAGSIAAHLFCLYFAMLSTITPPVAVGALVAARIAGAGFIRTAIDAIKLCGPGFILPFFIILCPVLTLQGSIGSGVISYIALTLGFASIAVGINGYLLTEVKPLERLFFVACGAVLLSFAIIGHYILLGIPLVALVLLCLKHVPKKGQTEKLIYF